MESSERKDVWAAGALTQTVLDRAAPASIRGIDPSDAFIGYATAHVLDPRASFTVGDARALPSAKACVRRSRLRWMVRSR